MILYSADHGTENLIDSIQQAFKGSLKASPAPGTEKYYLYLNLINRFIRKWATDPHQLWESRYDIRNLGTISATQSYDIDADVFKLAEYVYVTTPQGNKVMFTAIQPYVKPLYTSSNTNQAPFNYNISTNTVYLSGNNPQQITFTKAITSQTDIFGGSLSVPCYTIPDPLKNPTDLVVIDSTIWLINAVAAELARNSSSKQDQYAYLNDIANDEYERMVSANQELSFAQPNRVEVVMQMPGDLSDYGAY